MKKASNEKIIEAYQRLSNIWKVGEEVGLCGQAVHQRLKKLGLLNKQRVFTEAERVVILKEYNDYANVGKLSELSKRLGRDKTYLCNKAAQLGLTNAKRTRQYQNQEKSARAKKQWQENGHPRGMLGKKHTEEALGKMRAASKEMWAKMTPAKKRALVMLRLKTKALKGSLYKERKNTSWKSGWREIGGIRKYYRSRWEANYARYLQWLKELGNIASWEHEPETFWFEGIRRGSTSYLPDFKVTALSGAITYHEVKGWMDARSKTKLKRMKKYYPSVVMVLIEKNDYKEIKSKVSGLIPEWED